MNKRICQYCSKEFIAKKTFTKYCSNKCRAYKSRLTDKRISKGQVISGSENAKQELINRICKQINNLEKKMDKLGKTLLKITPQARKIYAIMKRDSAFHLSHSEFMARYEAELNEVVILA